MNLSGIAGYALGTAIYEANAIAIQDALQKIFNKPETESNVIPFPQRRPKFPEDSKNCPPDDGCERDQKLLLGRQLRLQNMKNANLISGIQYARVAQLYNADAKKHNVRCPKNKVRLLPLS